MSDNRISPLPPAELRIRNVTEVLTHIGFADAAGDLLDDWQVLHQADDGAGVEAEFYFPIGGGRFAALPESIYLEPVRRLARVLCTQQVDALSGMHLVDVPGFHFARSRDSKSSAAMESYRRGHPAVDDPRVLVSAAALTGYREPSLRVPTLELLRRGLSAGRADARPAAGVGAPALGADEDWLSPDVIRDAIVLQSVIRRPG